MRCSSVVRFFFSRGIADISAHTCAHAYIYPGRHLLSTPGTEAIVSVPRVHCLWWCRYTHAHKRDRCLPAIAVCGVGVCVRVFSMYTISICIYVNTPLTPPVNRCRMRAWGHNVYKPRVGREKTGSWGQTSILYYMYFYDVRETAETRKTLRGTPCCCCCCSGDSGLNTHTRRGRNYY